MKSTIKTYLIKNEIQRVQIVECDDWRSLNFFMPKISKEALKHIASIYQDFFVKKAPIVFGTIYVFHIPDDIDIPFDYVGDRHIACKEYFKKHFNDKVVQDFMKQLEDDGWLYVVKGMNIFYRQFVPYKDLGFISQELIDSKLRVNSNFFTFDLFDCQSKYDTFGTPLGLCLKDGVIINPPLFHREALLVDNDNKVSIRKVELNELTISINGRIYERPDYKHTPKNNDYDVIIIGNKIVDIKKGGDSVVPSSGFVINTKEDNHYVGETVTYGGLENYIFGIQCGNSIVVNGKRTDKFISKFYHLLRPGEVQYPPTQYPHNFDSDRAPRIALCANSKGKPVIMWVEGASKMKYTEGIDSAGASLKEMADILEDLNLPFGINLDGGGSAQILIDGHRSLKISDRDFKDNSESERPVPIGLYIE